MRKGQGRGRESRCSGTIHSRTIHPRPPPLLGSICRPSELVLSPFAAAFPEEAPLPSRDALAASRPAAWHSEGAALAQAEGTGQPPAGQPLSLPARQNPSSRSAGADAGHGSAHPHPPRAGSCRAPTREPVPHTLAAPKVSAETRTDTLPASNAPGDAQQHLLQPRLGRHQLLGASRPPPTSAGSWGCRSEGRGEAGDPACPALASRPATGKCALQAEHRQRGAAELQPEPATTHVGLRTKQQASIYPACPRQLPPPALQNRPPGLARTFPSPNQNPGAFSEQKTPSFLHPSQIPATARDTCAHVPCSGTQSRSEEAQLLQPWKPVRRPRKAPPTPCPSSEQGRNSKGDFAKAAAARFQLKRPQAHHKAPCLRPARALAEMPPFCHRKAWDLPSPTHPHTAGSDTPPREPPRSRNLPSPLA